jgi:hypothetical protein
MKNEDARFTFLWMALFGIAFGFVECAVVVYLRELYYPGGFNFPLKLIGNNVAVTELLREAATMVMLITVALLASRKAIVRFAWFIYAFAFWDIFYYVFLYLLLGWPHSLLTWDILFLIPVTWTGPVIAPVINSLTMILLAVVIIRRDQKEIKANLNLTEWLLIITGSLATIFVYTQDYMAFMLRQFTLGDILKNQNSREILDYSLQYVPVSFNWPLFILCELLFLAATGLYLRRKK